MKILLSYILSFILFAQIILGQSLENYKDEKLDKKHEYSKLLGSTNGFRLYRIASSVHMADSWKPIHE